MEAITFTPQLLTLVLLSALWTLPWKAVALWQAVKNRDKFWFVVLLIFNTLAILEILYIFWLGKKQVPEANLTGNEQN